MSQAPQENPYTAPPTAALPAGGSEPFTGKIDYLAVFRYVTTSPNWMLNVLLAFVGQLVPIVGPIVVVGYLFDAVETLVRDPRRSYPDFDFNRLQPYFMRGLWPVLVTLVLFLFIGPLLAVGVVVLGVVPILTIMKMGKEAILLVPVVVLVDVLLWFAVFAVLNIALVPIMLAAGLTQSFGAAFDFSFIRDFARRVWKETLLLTLVFGLLSALLSFVGICALCIGFYLAYAFCSLAAAHMYYQLYALYLIRGGKPLPLQEPALPA